MAKEKYELAEEDYLNGMKYKELAEKYDVSINTIKSWKQRYKWCKDKKSVHTKTEKVCTQNNKEKSIQGKPIVEEVIKVIENDELTDKQKLFCIYYSKCFNQLKSYQKAYECSYEMAAKNAYRLMENEGIKARINELTQVTIDKEILKSIQTFQTP